MAQRKFGSVKSTDTVILTSVSLTADVSGVLPVANGGNGTGTFTDGQILIGQTSGNTLAKAVLSAGATMDKTGAVTLTNFVAAGASHANGAVPDPGATSHSPAWLLGDDAAFHALTGGGQVLYDNQTIPAGNTITATTETAAASTYTLPGTTLSAGDVLIFRLAGTTGGTVMPTLTVKLKFGSTIMANTGAISGLVTGTSQWYGEVRMTVQSVGAAGNIKVNSHFEFSTAATAALNVLPSSTLATLDTTADQAITVTFQWGMGGTSQTLTLEELVISRLTLTGASFDINGLTAADVALTDTFPEYNASAAANRKVSFNRMSGYVLRGTSQARLSLSSTLPRPSSDITSAATLYLIPFGGNGASPGSGGLVSIYDGTRWVVYTLPSSVSVPVTVTSGKMYDVFLYNNSGTLTLLLGAAWTNDTTRANALGTQDGIYVNGVSVTYNSVTAGAGAALWLGVVRGSGTNTLEDSKVHFFVCNAYNKLPRMLRATPGYVNDNAYSSYTTSSTTWVEANGGTGSKVDFISDGVSPSDVAYSTYHDAPAASPVPLTGVGIDSASSATFGDEGDRGSNGANSWSDILSEGYHYFDLLIAVNTASSRAWYADMARFGASADVYATQMTAIVWG